jgi:hypothetical protein
VKKILKSGQVLVNGEGARCILLNPTALALTTVNYWKKAMEQRIKLKEWTDIQCKPCKGKGYIEVGNKKKKKQ